MLKWLQHRLKGDPVIWTVVFLLCMISLLVVYSAVSARAFRQTGGNTEVFLIRHSVYLIIALTAMWFTHKMNYKYFMGLSKVLLVLSALLLAYAFMYGVVSGGASRWIKIPLIGVTFQPSDLAKFALISHLAGMLAKRQKDIADFKKTLIPALGWSGGICLLIALSDLSSACVLMATCFVVMFIGRVSFKHLMSIVLVCVVGIVIALKVGQRWETAKSRADDWWVVVTGNYESAQSDIPYQVQRANMAIASGGVIGKGIANGQQRYFLPEAYADYVYAIIVEEGGLILGFLVVGLYLILLYRGMVVMEKSQEPFGGLLATGLSFSLVIQALVNMAVVVGLGPVTGLPLPFISMGGTALLFTGITVGIILSVSRGTEKEEVSTGNVMKERDEEEEVDVELNLKDLESA